MIRVDKSTSGMNELMLYAYNEKTDGTEASNYLRIQVAKDGTRTYNIANPDNFRTAINANEELKFASYTLPQITIAANNYADIEYTTSPPTGYKLGAITQFRSFSTSVVVIGAYIVSNTKVCFQLRNVSNGSLSPKPWIAVMFIKA